MDVSHVRREANGAAHMVAKLKLYVEDEILVHIEEASQCVTDVVMADQRC
jgi:hypothetical protein